MEGQLVVNLDRGTGEAKPRSVKQDDQLARAREVALANRRVRTRRLLEERLAAIRAKMGDLSNEQLERAVRMLTETEDRHRSKLAALVEEHTSQLRRLTRAIEKPAAASRSVASSASVVSSVAPYAHSTVTVE